MRKGIDPIISTVLLIAIVAALAAFISPWAFNLATRTTNQTATEADLRILCQNAGYDFETTYGSNGVISNFSGTSDSISVKLLNTGQANLHNFSFELFFNSSDSGLVVKEYMVNSSVQKTSAQPLKPGSSVILQAIVTDNLNGTLKNVKIRNEACPSVFAAKDV